LRFRTTASGKSDTQGIQDEDFGGGYGGVWNVRITPSCHVLSEMCDCIHLFAREGDDGHDP
jgi:hypothetical protein